LFPFIFIIFVRSFKIQSLLIVSNANKTEKRFNPQSFQYINQESGNYNQVDTLVDEVGYQISINAPNEK